MDCHFRKLILEQLQNERTGRFAQRIVSRVLDALAQSLSEGEDLHTSGTTNILKHPMSDSERASNLLSTFEEKEQLLAL